MSERLQIQLPQSATRDCELLGLTLIQPWAWAVCHGGKRIENRSWAPPRWAIGKRLAIHAGKKYDADAADEIEFEFGLSVPVKRLITLGAVVATAKLVGSVRESEDPWFVGPHGWQLEDVWTLPEPVPCSGALGLWRLPDAVLQAVPHA